MNSVYNDAMLFHNCDQRPEPIFVDDLAAKKVKEFSNRFSKRPSGTKEKITGIKNVSKFLKENFLKMHKVYTITNNGQKVLMNPDQIKIKNHDSNKYAGITSTVYKESEPPVFESISIYKPHSNKTLFDSIYLHELVHTQIESVQNSYNDIYNSELISFLLELIYSYWYRGEDNEQLINYQVKSMSELLSDYAWKLNSNNKDISISIYYNSLIKAIYLFDIFKSLNKNGKKKLLKDIQLIFDGKLSIEDLLVKYNIPEINDIYGVLPSIACRV